MPEFDWALARNTLTGFGGVPITLYVDKTGLPFYDALRLYGAIDLYIGTREDVSICDRGDRWEVSARTRAARLVGRDLRALREVTGSSDGPAAAQFCTRLRESLTAGSRLSLRDDRLVEAPSELDPVLQSGIRGISAAEYDSMNSSSNPRCKARIPLSEALTAYAGRCRTEGVGEIRFLPVFEGRIDLGKIVSPLRAWLSVPNPLCAQVLMLLSLKTALWVEGYDKALSAVTYSKRTPKTSMNYSGIIRIDSTAVGRIDDGAFCARLYLVFRKMVSASWKDKKATPVALHTLSVAEWLMQPLPRNLGPMISAQEFLLKDGLLPFLIVPDNVRKVFQMTYPQRRMDHDAVRKLAKAVSSAIYYTAKNDDPKHWYNEVVALRNAPHKEAFRRRVLTLIEQSRTRNDWIGTAWRGEAFDPASLMDSMGEGRSFEEFRDCFRMYLIQESAPKGKAAPDANDDTGEDAGTENRVDVGEEGQN